MASAAVGAKVYKSYPTARILEIRAQAKRIARAERWGGLKFVLPFVGGGVLFWLMVRGAIYLHYHPLLTWLK